MKNLVYWCQKREETVGEDSSHSLNLTFYVYEDDILAIEIGQKAAEKFMGLPHLLRDRNGFN